MKDLMIDLETLSTGPNAAVVSIGAVYFDVEKGTLGEEFYRALNLDEQLRFREVSADTLKWWMNQSDEAKKLFREDSIPVALALEELSNWIRYHEYHSYPHVHVWGNGSTFDITILESLYRQYNVPVPWQFFNVMDLRTFRRFVAGNAKVERIGTHHNALDDAMSQAQYVLDHMGKK